MLELDHLCGQWTCGHRELVAMIFCGEQLISSVMSHHSMKYEAQHRIGTLGRNKLRAQTSIVLSTGDHDISHHPHSIIGVFVYLVKLRSNCAPLWVKCFDNICVNVKSKYVCHTRNDAPLSVGQCGGWGGGLPQSSSSLCGLHRLWPACPPGITSKHS